MSYALLQSSAHAIPLADESVQTCVTSPPYWGLREYAGEQEFVWDGKPEHAHEWGRAGTRSSSGGLKSTTIGNGAGQATSQGTLFVASTGAFCPCGAWRGALGLEPTPELYVEHMVEVFREVRRVLKQDGTLWLNLGDSYATQGGSREYGSSDGANGRGPAVGGTRTAPGGLKPKDLVGIPWRVAFALQADGWYLRSDIIWSKPNPMPESVTDRPTKAHEYIFLLSKSLRYYFDQGAVREEASPASLARISQDNFANQTGGPKDYRNGVNPNRSARQTLENFAKNPGRNIRTVWEIATQPYAGAHFATFPRAIPDRCIKAGSKPGDVVLDPFNGSGTTGRSAVALDRDYVGLDVSREYLDLALERVDPIMATARNTEQGTLL